MGFEMAKGPLMTVNGEWQISVFYDGVAEAIALQYGDINTGEVYCRIHSSCITAHVFGSIECDCREQMDLSMKAIREQGSGVIIYLDQEGRSNGNYAHIATQSLKREGFPQSVAYEKLGFPRDNRDYSLAIKVLKEMKINNLILLSNNPEKLKALADANLNVRKHSRPISILPDNAYLKKQYLDKKEVDGHYLD